jgi:hypothetical protein
MTPSSNVRMADLTDGTRISHVRFLLTGIIRVTDGVTEILWDTIFGGIQVSDDGPVYPQDVEVIAAGEGS